MDGDGHRSASRCFVTFRSKDYAQWRMTVLPYSWDPRFVYLEDDRLGIEYKVEHDGMVVTGTMDFYDFPFSWEFHHPN